jgi:hypothetical protein
MEGHYDLGNAELAQRYPEAKIIVSGGNYRVCIRRRPSDCRMRAGTASSMMALREGQAAC